MNASIPSDRDHRALRRALAAAAGLLIMLTAPSVALGHAELESSAPAAGDVLTTAPTEVVLTFSEAVVGNSSFKVLDAAGATVATGAPDAAAPTTMRAALPALDPGVYEVQWTSVADDGDILRGTFTFTVAEPTPPPPTATPAPTATVTEAPIEAPTPTTAPSPSSTGSGGTAGSGGNDVLIPILVVGLLIAGGLVYFLRRRAPA